MAVRFILLSIIFVYVNGQVFCPDGWQNFEAACYKLIEKELSWEEASTYCQENSYFHYGHLATIHSELENDFITYVVLKGKMVRTWIAANDRNVEGTFEWAAHYREPFLYAKWKEGEPNNMSDMEDCVEINRGGPGKWNDCKCKKRLQFICELELYVLAKGGRGYKSTKSDPRFPL